MKNKFKLFILSISSIFLSNLFAATLTEDAIQRGISETCASYLQQIEKSYNLNGLNITTAHQKNPSLYPSLHTSSKKYNNGSSTFSVTLNPDGEYCYLSTVKVTAVDNQNCNEITKLKLQEAPDLKVSYYAEGDYTIITPNDNSYQDILIASGEMGCTMTETRMIWPGR